MAVRLVDNLVAWLRRRIAEGRAKQILEQVLDQEVVGRRAQTEGEREAAARAICRLAVRILEIREIPDPEIRNYQFPDFGVGQK